MDNLGKTQVPRAAFRPKLRVLCGGAEAARIGAIRLLMLRGSLRRAMQVAGMVGIVSTVHGAASWFPLFIGALPQCRTAVLPHCRLATLLRRQGSQP